MSSCQILNEKLTGIEKKINELEGIKEQFIQTGDDSLKGELNQVKQQLDSLIKDYYDFAYPEYEKGARIFLLEKEGLNELTEVIRNIQIEDCHIISLGFSQNNLWPFFQKDPYFLKRFSKLKVVNLSGCQLSSLSSENLPESIEKIYAGNNPGIQINLKDLNQLKVVNLSYCRLSSLSSENLPESIEEIYASDNPNLILDPEIRVGSPKFPNLKKIIT